MLLLETHTFTKHFWTSPWAVTRLPLAAKWSGDPLLLAVIVLAAGSKRFTVRGISWRQAEAGDPYQPP